MADVPVNDYLDWDAAPFDPQSIHDVDLFSAMRVLAVKTKLHNANAERAAAEVARINEWEARVNDPLRSEIDRIQQWVERKVTYERSQTGQKTFSTPWGTVRTTEAKPRVSVTDAAALIAWAKAGGHEHADMIRVREEPVVMVVKNAVLFHGMDLPGVEVVPPVNPFNVSINTEE